MHVCGFHLDICILLLPIQLPARLSKVCSLRISLRFFLLRFVCSRFFLCLLNVSAVSLLLEEYLCLSCCFGCWRGRVAQYGLKSSLQRGGSRFVLISSRIEHQPPKLGVEGSNPSPPAIVLGLEPEFIVVCSIDLLLNP
jgi:hypothetical protein